MAVKPTLEISKKFVLCTIHRAENTDDSRKIKNIFEALSEMANEMQIILPLHPRTKKMAETLNLKTENITIIDPVGYLEMVWLIDNCSVVVTDSGGLQKEAYFFSKPCITLRDETEWVELVEIGANVLVGADKENILKTFKNCSKFSNKYSNANLYGDGQASKRICEFILKV